MRVEVDLQTRKTSITVLGSRLRYLKPTKIPFQTPTKQLDQKATSTFPAETPSNNHHQPPMATPEFANPNVRVGVVVRYGAGVVRGALSDKFTLPMNVEDVKALACKLVVVFTLELGLREVVFEGDSETITKAINSALKCLSSFGHLIDDVKTLALNFVSAIFANVKRQGNTVANILAKTAKCIPCPHIWSVDLSCNVQQLVTIDSISVD
nr:hypothetical protein CFP56_58499 [Quercus suber]